jgi:hypothetical protein
LGFEINLQHHHIKSTFISSDMTKTKAILFFPYVWIGIFFLTPMTWGLSSPPSPMLLSSIRQAMTTSIQSANNITAAYEACQQWQDILQDDGPSSSLDGNIVAISRALQASCLVRIGRDDQAIDVYDQALQLQACLDEKTRQDVSLGKAQALQRLLKYDRAKEQFLQTASSLERGALGAATCALRLGDVDDAIAILRQHCSRELSNQGQAGGMLATLLVLNSEMSSQEARPLLEQASETSVMYRWISHVLCHPTNSVSDTAENPTFLDLIKINQSPYDDPSLIQLDDKVNLHNLLQNDNTSKTSAFWPQGIILPAETNKLQNLVGDDDGDDGDLWICKQRAGYGSHGNQIVTTKQAVNLRVAEECLLQQMVDPPLLLEGRKFSLRIYVVSFGDTDLFVSTHGLVKLASVPVAEGDDDANDERVHMTNSGRETHMIQQDLQYLQRQFQQSGLSYGTFWKDLRQAIGTVMKVYNDERATILQGGADWDDKLSRLGIPKIMGFDFVVDGACQPWLVEVNRFPGLEPRDDSDRQVKHQIVRDAWMCAAERLGIENHPVQTILDGLICYDSTATSSLERI